MASRSSGAAGSRREPSRTTEDSGRVSKRRKLDAEKTGAPSYTAFRYGRYGQVEPGALTMEIVSCDGGLYSGGSSYAAENILKNDNSVYCTKGNRCNIVLQHQGCTTFSLKELIIKAPGRNYSSPVKAGMVYLSMSKDELLRAEQYNANDRNMSDAALDQAVQEVCARASSSSPLLDYLSSDTFRSMGARIMVGNSTDNSDATRERQIQDMRRLVETARESLMQDAARAQQSTGQDTTTQLGFVVLTECSDDEDYAVPGATSRDRDPTDLEWRWSPTPLRNRPRRRLPVYDESTPLGTHLSWEVSRYRDNDDDEDDEDEDDEANEDEDEEDYTDAYQLDLGNPTASSPDSLPNESEDAPTAARSRAGHSHHSRDRANSRSGGHGFGGGASATDSINRAPLHGRTSTLSTRSLSSRPTSLPHAEFHIEPGKNKCTIVFDPPVTARYILLKMWNPSVDYDDNSNIDIQGVVAKGFAGPRYFPAMELR
ncbi:hypothetical protein SCUCBS95973_001735 [Sporothrix curviconia]|uniref:Uncharacterized protein n=1 Tax=Sporothrix curviconia TaxID=1260050 RepID=A0ABP0B149_9PEZI